MAGSRFALNSSSKLARKDKGGLNLGHGNKGACLPGKAPSASSATHAARGVDTCRASGHEAGARTSTRTQSQLLSRATQHLGLTCPSRAEVTLRMFHLLTGNHEWMNTVSPSTLRQLACFSHVHSHAGLVTKHVAWPHGSPDTGGGGAARVKNPEHLAPSPKQGDLYP